MDNTALSRNMAKRNLFTHIVLFRWMKKSTIVEIIAVLYISMFVYTAISKWMDFTLSREQMALMPLMSGVAHIVIWLLPLTELVIAVLMYFSRTRKLGFNAATILMTLFTLYIIYMMLFYPNLPCSCGGFLDALSWTGHIVFNGVYIVLGLVALRLLKNGSTPSGKAYNIAYSATH